MFASIESGWGGDTCGVLVVDADDTLSAMRNTGGAPSYYRGVTLAEVGTLPVGADVPPDAFTGIVGRMAAGAGSVVVESLDNGAIWADLGYPTGGDIRSLVYV